ncbi:unnamed protein product [Vicia faba]|uniref:Uncharacterized protein n=1 Tax=Vicia faba TaxID=3906 RepID=A0AAV0ZT38_VICFA|nr:unnamed protein product [Vicia faba]
MVRAGKHGHCIGGRRSAFYLGSALTYQKAYFTNKGKVVSREPCNLAVPGNRPHRPGFQLTIEAIERVPNADEGYRLSVDAEPTSLSSVREGRTCCLLAISPRSCTARSSSPASPFPLSPFVLPSKSRMEYSQVVRHRFLVPACKVPEPSPGGMHGSLALHGTGVRSPPPSNLTLPRSPYELELRSPGAKRF